MHVLDATESDFQQKVLDASFEVPVLVDFWAEWCGPCRQLTPVLEAAVEARNGDVRLVKVDTDANPRLSQTFGIRGICNSWGLTEFPIVTFATLRPYEFIRNGPVWHRLPVRIVGVGGGFEYGAQGLSHHGLEDVGVMRVQPGMTVVAPADHEQMATALRATWNVEGPVYYRIGKDDKTVVPGLRGRFRPGHAEVVREGDHVALVAMGSVASEAAAAAAKLAEHGIDARVIVVASVQPAPADDLQAALADVPLAVTVEAHYANGGLGSLVAEVIAERGLGCRLVRQAVHDLPDARVGSQSYMHGRHGLAAPAIVDTVLERLGRRA